MTPEQGSTFSLNLVPPEGRLPLSAEQQEAKDWYEKQLRLLPPFQTKDSQMTGVGGWEAKLTPDRQVISIEGRHFRILGREIVKGLLRWVQPILIQRSEKFTTKEGKVDEISGIVLLLKNPDGKIFISVDQEPGIQVQNVEGKNVRPIVRTPFQASIEKLQRLSGGDEKADPSLHSILDILSKGNGKDLSLIVQDIPFRKVSTDGNRMESNVLYGAINLTREAADLVERENPQGKFVSRDQLNVLPFNGHLHIALSATSQN